MSEKVLNRIYKRIIDYCLISDLAVDTPKIANLAYEEMAVSFLEIIYKFNGLSFIIKKIESEDNAKCKLKLSALLLPFNKEIALKCIKSLSNERNFIIRDSVNNILTERYDSIDEITNGYSKLLEKIRLKRKI